MSEEKQQLKWAHPNSPTQERTTVVQENTRWGHVPGGGLYLPKDGSVEEEMEKKEALKKNSKVAKRPMKKHSMKYLQKKRREKMKKQQTAPTEIGPQTSGVDSNG